MARHYAYMKKVAKGYEPKTYVEASQDAKGQSAMEDEMRALAVNETWDLVNPPRHYKLIRCKRMYNVDGSVNRYKAQSVAKSYV